MTFDQELKSAFDALSDRLQAEVARQVQAALEERAAADAARPPVEDAGPAEEDAGPAEAGHCVPESDEKGDGLLDTIRAMDESRSLTDALDALTTGVAGASTRAAVLLRRSGAWHTWRAIGFDGDVDPGELADRAARPIVIGGETIGAVYADGGSAASIEILARHASRCLESMTAFRTARALARQATAPREDAPNDEDASARRYAKLLVSEIKLYHENDVVAGRRERDLGTRLGGEIARARVLYDQRVPPHVRQRADYFREELVRTLADGDSTLLEFHA